MAESDSRRSARAPHPEGRPSWPPIRNTRSRPSISDLATREAKAAESRTLPPGSRKILRALVCPRADDEIVGERGDAGEVQHANIGGLFRFGGAHGNQPGGDSGFSFAGFGKIDLRQTKTPVRIVLQGGQGGCLRTHALKTS